MAPMISRFRHLPRLPLLLLVLCLLLRAGKF